MIEVMDKEAADTLGNELRAAAKEVAARHGVELWGGVGVTYYPDTGEAKFRGTFRLQDADAVAFRSLAKRYGLSADDLGRKITDAKGRTFTIIGLHVKGRGDPKVVVDLDGEEKITSVEHVRDSLNGVDRTAEGLKAKPGDKGTLNIVKPKYMDGTSVEVVAVDAETELLTVRLTNRFDKKPWERWGGEPFDVPASLFRKWEYGAGEMTGTELSEEYDAHIV